MVAQKVTRWPIKCNQFHVIQALFDTSIAAFNQHCIIQFFRWINKKYIKWGSIKCSWQGCLVPLHNLVFQENRSLLSLTPHRIFLHIRNYPLIKTYEIKLEVPTSEDLVTTKSKCCMGTSSGRPGKFFLGGPLCSEEKNLFKGARKYTSRISNIMGYTYW